MAPNIHFEPLSELFSDGPAYSKDLLKTHVLDDLKRKELIGTPDDHLRIRFNPEDGSDILVHKIDPENALGYSVYPNEKDYFDRLSASLYEPSEEDISGGLK